MLFVFNGLFFKIDFQFCDEIMLFVSDALFDCFVNGCDGSLQKEFYFIHKMPQ